MKKILALLCVILVLGIGGYLFLHAAATIQTTTPVAQNAESQLTLLPQTATTSVRVDSATFQHNGYVVVRGVDGNRLGQIIEVSKYFLPGTYKNILISLGDFYTGDQDLFVAIYNDDGDKEFPKQIRP